ncbi:MAG: hypothetical protein D6701_08405 [Gemmatimonadetes bacterium]|nr:MAG: hypothetical protein D6701_08405 [Gemmatimonadota bacterium]
MTDLLGLLEDARAREKARTLAYRALAAEAEELGDAPLAERLNALHADEQHHLSRLTARVLELGGRPAELARTPSTACALDGWEAVQREAEEDEVRWYERALATLPRDDVETEALLAEILESERHHARELGGKWMPA